MHPRDVHVRMQMTQQSIVGSCLCTEKGIIYRQAAAKFRIAIRNRPDYDRCCYNLGTVCYRYSMQLQRDIVQMTSELQQFAVGAASHSSPTTFAVEVNALEDEVCIFMSGNHRDGSKTPLNTVYIPTHL